jgi:hypothetical protein
LRVTPASAPSQADFAAALLDSGLPCPGGLVAWNGSDPAARFAVYRNNVVSSLIDALADTFPVVQELVGVEFFRAMASVFVRQAPPRSRILAHYGAGMAGFISQFEPARSVPYLADMARLESARVRAYHAAEAVPLDSAAVSLALASGEQIGELTMACQPSVAVIDSAYAVVSLWAAHQGDGDVATVDPDAPQAALVVRQGLEVVVLRLPPGGAPFVTEIMLGRNLGQATAAAAQVEPEFDLPATLALLFGNGAVTAIALAAAA